MRSAPDPQVCQAATRTGVEWAITGGRVFTWASQSQRAAYAGVDAVGTSAAWQKVAHAGYTPTDGCSARDSLSRAPG